MEYERVGGGWAPLNPTSTLWRPRDEIRVRRRFEQQASAGATGGGEAGRGPGPTAAPRGDPGKWRSPAAGPVAEPALLAVTPSGRTVVVTGARSFHAGGAAVPGGGGRKEHVQLQGGPSRRRGSV